MDKPKYEEVKTHGDAFEITRTIYKILWNSVVGLCVEKDRTIPERVPHEMAKSKEFGKALFNALAQLTMRVSTDIMGMTYRQTADYFSTIATALESRKAGADNRN